MATASSPSVERRTSHRVPSDVDISYGSGGEFIPASSCDLSAAGMGLLGPKLYPIGSEVQVRLRAPRESSSGNLLFLRGTVRHATGNRLGLRFTRMTHAQREELRIAIENLGAPG
jgi:c-di-GMP-binding flagellar brake protein YcgR